MRIIFTIIFYLVILNFEPINAREQKTLETLPEPNQHATFSPSNECQEFDLREKGQSMEHIPTLDQGNIGDCYAYAASSAADAWLHSNTDSSHPLHKAIISPTLSAFYTKKDNNEMAKKTKTIKSEIKGAPKSTTLDGDSVSKTLQSIKLNGACNYEKIERKLENSTNGQDPTTFVNQITNIYTTFHGQLVNTIEITNETERKAKEDEIIHNAIENYHASMLLGGFKDRSTFFDLKTVRAILLKPTVDDGNAAFVGNLCPSDSHFSMPTEFPDKYIGFSIDSINRPSFLGSSAARSKILNNVIEAALKFKNRQPIIISYCSVVLYNSKAEGISPAGKIAPTCAPHGSLIVARKKTPSGCEFIIRNSWGSQERSDSAMWNNENSPQMDMDENGDVHVPTGELLKNIAGINLIAPKGETYDLSVNVENGAQQAFEDELKIKEQDIKAMNQNKPQPRPYIETEKNNGGQK